MAPGTGGMPRPQWRGQGQWLAGPLVANGDIGVSAVSRYAPGKRGHGTPVPIPPAGDWAGAPLHRPKRHSGCVSTRKCLRPLRAGLVVYSHTAQHRDQAIAYGPPGRWGGGGHLGPWSEPADPPNPPTSENFCCWVGEGGVGTRPRYSVVCLWRRLLASRHILTLCGSERVLVVFTEPPYDLSCLTTPGVGRPGVSSEKKGNLLKRPEIGDRFLVHEVVFLASDTLRTGPIGIQSAPCNNKDAKRVWRMWRHWPEHVC